MLIKQEILLLTTDYYILKEQLKDKFVIDSEFYKKKINFKRELTLNSNLFTSQQYSDNKKLIVSSEECKNRLIYSLYTAISKDSYFILNYYQNSYIPDFYKDIRDFKTNEKYILLNTSSLVELNLFKGRDYVINYNIVNSPIFFFRNEEKIDNKIFLMVRHRTEMDAIECSYNWLVTGSVFIKDIKENQIYSNIFKEFAKDVNIVYYIFSGDDIMLSHEKDIDINDKNNIKVAIVKEEKGTYQYFNDDSILEYIEDTNTLEDMTETKVNYFSMLPIENRYYLRKLDI